VRIKLDMHGYHIKYIHNLERCKQSTELQHLFKYTHGYTS